MGNKLCNRILTRNTETIKNTWKETYNNKMGIQVFLGNKTPEDLLKLIECSHVDNQLKERFLTHLEGKDIKITGERKESNSELLRKFELFKAQIDPEILQKKFFDVENRSGFENSLLADAKSRKEMLYMAGEETSLDSSLISFKLELCYILHVWSNYLSQKTKEVEEGDEKYPDLNDVLNAFQGEKNEKIKSKILLVTFVSFFENFMLEIQNLGKIEQEQAVKNEKTLFMKFEKNLENFENLFECIQESEPEARDCKDENWLKVKEMLKKICLTLTKILQKSSPSSETQSTYQLIPLQLIQKIFNLSLSLTFTLESITAHLLLLNTIKSNSKISQIKIKKIPYQLQNFYLHQIPFFLTKEKKTLKGDFLTYFADEKKSVSCVPYKDKLLLVSEDKTLLTSLNESTEEMPLFKEEEKDYQCYLYNGEPYGRCGDEIGPFKIDEFKIQRIWYMDYYTSMRSNCDPILEKFRRECSWNARGRNRIFLKKRNHREQVEVKVYENSSFDGEKKPKIYPSHEIKNYFDECNIDPLAEINKEKNGFDPENYNLNPHGYKYILTFLDHNKKGSGNWTNYQKERIIKLNNKPFGDWQEDETGNIRIDYIGGNDVMKGLDEAKKRENDYLIVIRNKRCLIVVNPETANVISASYFDSNSKAEIKKFYPEGDFKECSLKLDRIDGFNTENKEVYHVNKEAELEVKETEFTGLWNLAAYWRSYISFIGQKNNKKIDQTIEMLKVEEEETIADNDSDDDDDSEDDEIQENIFEKIFEKSCSGGKKNVTVSNLHQKVFDDFYYRYLDYLMRILYANKEVDFWKLNDTNSETKKRLMRDGNRIELSQKYFEVVSYFLKNFQKIEKFSKHDASFLMYLIKSLESHLEILKFLDPKKSKLSVVNNSQLKKIFSRLESISTIPYSESFGFAFNYFKTSITSCKIFISEILEKQKNLEDHFKDIFESYQRKEYNQLIKFVSYLTPKISKKKLKKIPSEDLNLQIEQKLMPYIEKVLKAEIETFGKILIDKTSTKKLPFSKEEDLPSLQYNLKGLLNCIISFKLKEKFPDFNLISIFLNKFFELFNSKKITTFIHNVNNLKKSWSKGVDFKEKKQGENSVKILKFNDFFNTTLTANILSFLSSVKEFHNSTLETLQIQEKTLTAFILTVQLVNSFGKVLKFWDLPSKEAEEQIFKFKNTKNIKLESTHKKYKLDFVNPEILEAKGALQLFKLRNVPKTKQQIQNKENGCLELIQIFSFKGKNFKNETLYLDSGDYLAVVSNIKEEVELKIKNAVKKEWRNKLYFVNLGKLVLSQIGGGEFKGIKFKRNFDLFGGFEGNENEEVKVEPNSEKFDSLKDYEQNNLLRFFHSGLFESGFNTGKFLEQKSDPVAGLQDQLKEAEIVQLLKNDILERAGVSESNLQIFEKWCKNLEKKCRKKDFRSAAGGLTGFNTCISLFALYLRHTSYIDIVLNELSDEDFIENSEPVYEHYWLKCTEIRMHIMRYETTRDFETFFSKLRFLAFLPQSEKYIFKGDDEEDEANFTGNESPRSKDRIKNYLTSIRDEAGEAGPEFETSSPIGRHQKKMAKKNNSLIKIILDFLKTGIDVDEILKFLSFQRREYERIESYLRTFLLLNINQGGSILIDQIIEAFNKIFRGNQGGIGVQRLTPSNAGISEVNQIRQRREFANIFSSFVKTLCKGPSKVILEDEERKRDFINTKLLCLDSLKWNFRGRETDIVQEIDLWKMWECNFGGKGSYEDEEEKTEVEEGKEEITEGEVENVEEIKENEEEEKAKEEKNETKEKEEDKDENIYDQRLFSSFIELVEILLGYCIKKIQKTPKPGAMRLTLQRQVSSYNESSLADVLTKIIKMLISELKRNLEKLNNHAPFQGNLLLDFVQRTKSLMKGHRNLAGLYSKYSFESVTSRYFLDQDHEFIFDDSHIHPKKILTVIPRKVGKNEVVVIMTPEEIKAFYEENNISEEIKGKFEEKVDDEEEEKEEEPAIEDDQEKAMTEEINDDKIDLNTSLPPIPGTPPLPRRRRISSTFVSSERNRSVDNIVFQPSSNDVASVENLSIRNNISNDSSSDSENSLFGAMFKEGPIKIEKKPKTKPKKEPEKEKNSKDDEEKEIIRKVEIDNPEFFDKKFSSIFEKIEKLKISEIQDQASFTYSIINILYSSIIQLPREIIIPIFENYSFEEKKLNSNLEVFINLATSSQPSTLQTVSFNILTHLFIDKNLKIPASISKKFKNAVLKNFSKKNSKNQNLNIEKFIAKLLNLGKKTPQTEDMMEVGIFEEEDSKKSNFEFSKQFLKQIKIEFENSNKPENFYQFLTDVLSSGTLNSQTLIPGEKVKIKNFRSSKNLILLDKEILPFYKYYNNKRSNWSKLDRSTKMGKFNIEGKIGSYHRIPVLDLESGEVFLEEEANIEILDEGGYVDIQACSDVILGLLEEFKVLETVKKGEFEFEGYQKLAKIIKILVKGNYSEELKSINKNVFGDETSTKTLENFDEISTKKLIFTQFEDNNIKPSGSKTRTDMKKSKRKNRFSELKAKFFKQKLKKKNQKKIEGNNNPPTGFIKDFKANHVQLPLSKLNPVTTFKKISDLKARNFYKETLAKIYTKTTLNDYISDLEKNLNFLIKKTSKFLKESEEIKKIDLECELNSEVDLYCSKGIKKGNLPKEVESRVKKTIEELFKNLNKNENKFDYYCKLYLSILLAKKVKNPEFYQFLGDFLLKFFLEFEADFKQFYTGRTVIFLAKSIRDIILSLRRVNKKFIFKVNDQNSLNKILEFLNFFNEISITTQSNSFNVGSRLMDSLYQDFMINACVYCKAESEIHPEKSSILDILKEEIKKNNLNIPEKIRDLELKVTYKKRISGDIMKNKETVVDFGFARGGIFNLSETTNLVKSVNVPFYGGKGAKVELKGFKNWLVYKNNSNSPIVISEDSDGKKPFQNIITNSNVSDYNASFNELKLTSKDQTLYLNRMSSQSFYYFHFPRSSRITPILIQKMQKLLSKKNQGYNTLFPSIETFAVFNSKLFIATSSNDTPVTLIPTPEITEVKGNVILTKNPSSLYFIKNYNRDQKGNIIKILTTKDRFYLNKVETGGIEIEKILAVGNGSFGLVSTRVGSYGNFNSEGGDWIWALCRRKTDNKGYLARISRNKDFQAKFSLKSNQISCNVDLGEGGNHEKKFKLFLMDKIYGFNQKNINSKKDYLKTGGDGVIKVFEFKESITHADYCGDTKNWAFVFKDKKGRNFLHRFIYEKSTADNFHESFYLGKIQPKKILQSRFGSIWILEENGSLWLKKSNLLKKKTCCEGWRILKDVYHKESKGEIQKVTVDDYKKIRFEDIYCTGGEIIFLFGVFKPTPENAKNVNYPKFDFVKKSEIPQEKSEKIEENSNKKSDVKTEEAEGSDPDFYRFVLYPIEKLPVDHNFSDSRKRIQKSIRYLRATKNSKITFLKLEANALLITNLEKNAITRIEGGTDSAEFRVWYHQGRRLDYPYACFYDKGGDKGIKKNEEKLVGINFNPKNFNLEKEVVKYETKKDMIKFGNYGRNLMDAVKKEKEKYFEELKLKEQTKEEKKVDENVKEEIKTEEITENVEISEEDQKKIQIENIQKMGLFMKSVLAAVAIEFEKDKLKKKKLEQRKIFNRKKFNTNKVGFIVTRPHPGAIYIPQAYLKMFREHEDYKGGVQKLEDLKKNLKHLIVPTTNFYSPESIYNPEKIKKMQLENFSQTEEYYQHPTVLYIENGFNFNLAEIAKKYILTGLKEKVSNFNHETEIVRFVPNVYAMDYEEIGDEEEEEKELDVIEEIQENQVEEQKEEQKIEEENKEEDKKEEEKKESDENKEEEILNLKKSTKKYIEDNYSKNYLDSLEKFKEYLEFLKTSTKMINYNYHMSTFFAKNMTEYYNSKLLENSNLKSDLARPISYGVMWYNYMIVKVQESTPIIPVDLLPPQLGTLVWFNNIKDSKKTQKEIFIASEPFETLSQIKTVNSEVTINTGDYSLWNDEVELLDSCEAFQFVSYFKKGGLHFNGSNSHEVFVDRFTGEKATREDPNLSLFAQCFEGIRENWGNEWDYGELRRIEFKFKGEPGIDDGGLKREYLNYISTQVMDEKMGMFIPSANQISGLGVERGRFIPNPKAIKDSDMRNFFMYGFVIGLIFKLGDILATNLPSIFWKFLLNQKLQWTDIKTVNHNIYVRLEEIENMKDEDFKLISEKFVVVLYDGTEMELKPNGANIELTPENKFEYVNLMKKMYMQQLIPAFTKMKEGFFTFHRGAALDFLTPKIMEEEINGMDFVDLEHLKNITNYSGFGADHEAVLRFWRVLKTFTQKQLSLYLKYVCGRSRLSHGMVDRHKLTYHPSKKGIPEAHTCYFELDLGEFESDEDLRKKLLYGIENCNEIAESNSAYRLDAGFGI